MVTKSLSSHEVFSFLRPEQVKAISDDAEVVSLPAGREVYTKGDEALYMFAVLEGQVALRLPREDGLSLQIEEVLPGALFGSCVCFQLHEYSLSAMCTRDTTLLKFKAATLQRLMDEDHSVGYPLQRMISQTYFKRYVDTMQKLQAIVQTLPLMGT